MKQVLVNASDLQSYMDEYHQQNGRGWCKADGEEWPCSVYSNLRAALSEDKKGKHEA